MEDTSLQEIWTMLLFFIKVWVSSATLAAYNIIVHGALFSVILRAADYGVMKICQNMLNFFKHKGLSSGYHGTKN